MDLNKKIEESLKEYKIRLFSNKEEYNLSFQQIADLINIESGESKNESTYRKWWSAYKEGYSDAKSSLNNDTIDKYEKIRTEAEKARIRFFDQRNSYNKMIREQARTDEIKSIIEESILSLPKIEVPKEININSNNTEEYCLFFGDEHYGTEFDIKGLNGETINSYSPKIFENRMWKLYKEVKDILLKNNIKKINIYSLGDFADGVLRVSQLLDLKYGIVDSTINYGNFISVWLNEISKFAKVRFQITDGNHTELRMLSQPKGTFKNENMTKIVKNIISIRLMNNPNFELVQNPTGYIFDNICGYNMLGIHGEEKNMEDSILKFSSIYHVNIDYLVAGHYHHNKNEEVGENSEVINIPSVMGSDKYSIYLKKRSSPAAKFIVFKDNYGKWCEYNIILK